jgi:hypothetical protein
MSEQGGDQVEALLGEPVLVALGARLVDAGLQQTLGHQRVEPVRENVGRDSQVLLELAEAAKTVGDVAEDEGRPPLTDEVERAGDRARVAVEAGPLHAGESIACVRRATMLGSLCL